MTANRDVNDREYSRKINFQLLVNLHVECKTDTDRKVYLSPTRKKEKN